MSPMIDGYARTIKPAKPRPCTVEGLDEQHAKKMLDSSLTLDTIRLSRAYTERNLLRLRLELRGIPANPPALILPFFDRDGKRVDYAVARMMPPHNWPDGREAKYLMPRGLDCRAYFPPFACAWQAVNDPGGAVVITEGVLKALAAAQVGVPCIGLMGIETWSLRRQDKDDPRQLIPDLLGIDWRGKKVLIVPDSDPLRKFGVNHGAAELARVLSELGADTRLPRLPFGPSAEDGRPLKQAVDDYIPRHGGESFARWVARQLESPTNRSLDDYRAEMLKCRIDNRTRPRPTFQDFADYPARNETLLDRCPTGAGKSYADVAAIRKLEEMSEMKPAGWHEMTIAEKLNDIGHVRTMRSLSLTIVPNHSHVTEVVTQAAEQGITMVPYPKLTSETCLRYDEASAVQNRGLPFQMVLCPECEYREVCDYRAQREQADDAEHAVATQARSVHTLHQQRWRNHIILHEVPLDVISPSIIVSRGLLVVELIARQAANDARDANGRGFFRHMGRVAKEMEGWLCGADKSDVVPIPDPPEHIPEDVHSGLNEAIIALGLPETPAEAMRLVLSAASGGLKLVGVGVDPIPDKSKAKEAVKIVRKLVGIVRTDLPLGCWLSDATADQAEIETALGRPVRDVTPPGRLLLSHPVLQVIPERDVTRGRTAKSVLPALLGLMHDLPHRRVGLLTHRKLSKELPALLSEEDRGRLVKEMVHYFGGGLSRGSNLWIKTCDALIVLGTPRIHPSDIRLHLFRLGKVKAAARTKEEAGWGWDCWSGVTESGQRRTVKCWHYADHDWHAAYCSLVRSELIQAIGRGRGILPQGIPVYVVTTENLAPPHDDDGRNGFPLAEEGRFSPLTDSMAKVLDAMKGAGQRIVTTAKVAKSLGRSVRLVLGLLTELQSAGRVKRVGQRGGWLLSGS